MTQEKPLGSMHSSIAAAWESQCMFSFSNVVCLQPKQPLVRRGNKDSPKGIWNFIATLQNAIMKLPAVASNHAQREAIHFQILASFQWVFQ